MLEDIYLEYMIKKKKTGGQTALIILLAILCLVLSLALLGVIYAINVGMQQAGTSVGQLVTCVGLLVVAALWYGWYLIKGMQNIEYEYILTNSEIDMDKIMSKKGRKHIVSLDFKDVEICADIEDEEHNYAYKNTNAEKVYDITGDKSRGGIYFADFTADGVKTRVLFQPTMKMITFAKRYNPKNIFVKED